MQHNGKNQTVVAIQSKALITSNQEFTEFDKSMKTLTIQHGLYLTEIFHDANYKPQICIQT